MVRETSKTAGQNFHYLPNTEDDRREMLRTLGIDSVEELFSDIPEQFRNPPFELPAPLSELELRRDLEALAAQNLHVGGHVSFLGAGAYNHFIPSVVRSITSRGEFLTAYTPYQAEASQGTLQATYDFQTMICNILGMEVADAGMYDGATALAEASLMACRITGRECVGILDSVSPAYRQVVNTYLHPQDIEIATIDSSSPRLPEGAAGLVVQYPNFFGYLEDLASLEEMAHATGALLVVSANPTAMALFRPPGMYNADIVTGEGQPLGIPISFGGPYVGLLATRQRYVRQMPGRIAGGKR